MKEEESQASVKHQSTSHLERAVSLLAQGYHCPNLEAWVAGATQATLPSTHADSVYCFAATVPMWVRRAVARTQGSSHAFAGKDGQPVVLQTLHRSGASRSKGLTKCPPAAANSVAPRQTLANHKNHSHDDACGRRHVGVVDSSIQYDSSLWRTVKAALWRFRRDAFLQLLSEVRNRGRKTHDTGLCGRLEHGRHTIRC